MAGVPTLPADIKARLEKLKKTFEERNYVNKIPEAEKFLHDLSQIEREGNRSILENHCQQFLSRLTEESKEDADKPIIAAIKETIQEFLLPRDEVSGRNKFSATMAASSAGSNKSRGIDVQVSPLAKTMNPQLKRDSQQSSGDKQSDPSGNGTKPKTSTLINVKNQQGAPAGVEKPPDNTSSTLEQRTKELEETIKERAKIEEECMQLTSRIEQFEAELQQKQEIIGRFECQHNAMYGEKQVLEEKNEGLKKTLEDQEEAYSAEREQNQKRINHLEDHIKATERKHKERERALIAERDDLRNRYSKLAGQALKDNNSDISDLSDPNRPMKLGEKFSELYDNEWTDIFQAQVDTLKRNEKEAIQVLLRTLEECYKFCKQLAEQQMSSLRDVFLYHCQDASKTVMGGKEKPRLHTKEEKSLLEVRKMIGASNSSPVKQTFLSLMAQKADKSDKKLEKEFTAYYEKCTEVCWLMALNDPPLFMDMECKSGSKVDLNLYTPYYTPGDKIDFLVWPPLFNVHRGGLINKGVIAPVFEKKKIKK